MSWRKKKAFFLYRFSYTVVAWCSL